MGAIGLPDVRHADGTEIAPHLRIRDELGLYAGVRPIKAYPNSPRRLSDERAANIDLIILRESTEGLFFTHGRGEVIDDAGARGDKPSYAKAFDDIQAGQLAAGVLALRATFPGMVVTLGALHGGFSLWCVFCLTFLEGV